MDWDSSKPRLIPFQAVAANTSDKWARSWTGTVLPNYCENAVFSRHFIVVWVFRVEMTWMLSVTFNYSQSCIPLWI